MIATTIAYDVVFLVHVVAAVAALTVLVAMRSAARAVAVGAPDDVQARRFPTRRNWAARVVHLLPLTGLVMVATGDSSVSLTRPWVGVGLACYLAAAGLLEARALPLEHVVAEVVAHDGRAARERGEALTRSIDAVLLAVGVALVAMVAQF